MKKHILNLIIIVLLVFSQSCSDILDKTPLDQYSDATVWTNPELASLYLNYVYDGIGHGFQSVKTTNYTDEAIYGRGASTTTLLNGTLTPDSGEGSHFGHSGYRWSLYGNIQRVNKFIDKIDLVVDAYPESQKAAIKAKTDVLKGEALFLRAYMYTNLARTYGGLVLLNSSAKLSDDFSTLQRSSFEETVSFIDRKSVV